MTATHLCARIGRLALLALIIGLPLTSIPARTHMDQVRVIENKGIAVLYFTITDDNFETVAYLLDHGVDVNRLHSGRHAVLQLVMFDSRGCTITKPECFKRAERMRWLIDHGAAPSTPNYIGWQTLKSREVDFPLQSWVAQPVLSPAERAEIERFNAALDYFELLDRSGAELPESISFYYGEALLRTGKPDSAIAKLYEYITVAGRDGEHYSRALELVNEAEANQ